MIEPNLRPIETLYFIDDCLDEQHVTRLLLRQSKIDIRFVPFQTAEAFQKSTEGAADMAWLQSLVVFDLNLTLGSGIEALKAFKARWSRCDVIAGLCTGSADPKDRKDAHEAGANFFLTKPLNLAALRLACGEVAELQLEPIGATDRYHLCRSLGRPKGRPIGRFED